MKVRATLKLRNELAISCREKLGLSQAEVGKVTKLGQSRVCAIECLRFDKIGEKAIANLASFYQVNPDDLVPPELRGSVLPNSHTLVREVPNVALLESSSMILLENKAAPMEAAELKAAIEKSLDKLSFQEREVIKLRYGIGDEDGLTFTGEEIGRIFRTSASHVRTIETRALDKIRRMEAREGAITSAAMGLDRE